MSFGDKLRRERERQSISLDQVAAATKISTRYLQAIEDEDLSRLPGGIFNRGFLRAYATFLDLHPHEADELVRDLTDASQPRPVASATSEPETPSRSRRLKWLGSSS